MTIISHSRKFIFLKAPKTAGTTIEHYLSLYCDPEQGDLVSDPHPDSAFGSTNRSISGASLYVHMPIKRLRNDLNQRYPGQGIWENYYKFAVIRNPWDWLLSLFWWKESYGNNKEWVVKQNDHWPNTIYINFCRLDCK